MGKIIDVIHRQCNKQWLRNWYETYWFIDCHGCIIRPNHKDELPNKLDFYPFALKSLKLLTGRSDIRMILYTCSHDYQIRHYINLLEEYSIEFDYINVNPEIGEGDVGCYDKKPYFDVYLDDKAGFDAENEWEDIFNFLRTCIRPNEKWRNPIRDRRRTNYLLKKENDAKRNNA